jgi:flagellar basal body-associated protein FliL
MAERVQVAAFVCAFRAATARANRFAEAEGDMDARRLAKALPLGGLAAMRAAWEKKWWRLEDHEVPAVSYLEKKLEELEEGEEPLGAIVPLETFLVNLSGGKYIRAQVQVEFESLDVPRRFYTRSVPIRDGIISMLTQMTAENLESAKGKDKLRAEIRSVINTTLRKEEVRRVYFTQFVIQ